MATSSPTGPQRTVLYEAHRRAGAVMVDFHGWEMPLRYGSIPEEHQKVRLCSGLFDLCHMGRLEVSGRGAEEWVERVITADLSQLGEGRARYTLFLNEEGGIIDDALVYRLPHSLLLVVNASNRSRVADWLLAHRPPGEARLFDRTEEWAMLALQGPHAARILPPLIERPERPWETLRYYQILSARFEGHPARVARTGYTGEDGFEVYLPREVAAELWDRILEAGGPRVGPAGLGARDTLRLEAGMPLYGNDIDETTDPFEAGLGFAVKLKKKRPFVGQKALEKIEAAGPRRRLCGFRVDGRRVARRGMRILQGEREVGVVTSGAPSPTLGYPIALGYLDTSADERAPLAAEVRGHRVRLVREALPFYSRTRRKAKE